MHDSGWHAERAIELANSLDNDYSKEALAYALAALAIAVGELAEKIDAFTATQ